MGSYIRNCWWIQLLQITTVWDHTSWWFSCSSKCCRIQHNLIKTQSGDSRKPFPEALLWATDSKSAATQFFSVHINRSPHWYQPGHVHIILETVFKLLYNRVREQLCHSCCSHILPVSSNLFIACLQPPLNRSSNVVPHLFFSCSYKSYPQILIPAGLCKLPSLSTFTSNLILAGNKPKAHHRITPVRACRRIRLSRRHHED